MPKSIESLVAFNSGEWSQSLAGRVDQSKYRSACIQLRNMLALKTGPATRRPGTQMIAPAKVITIGADFTQRTEGFQFSVNTKFTLEWGQFYVRFFSNGAQVTLSSAPTWISFSTTGVITRPGTFAEDPTDSNNIYYTAHGFKSFIQPHLDARWVKQSIYEVLTPYLGFYSGGDLTTAEVNQIVFLPINDVIYIFHPLHPRAKLTRYGDTDWRYEEVQDLIPPLLDQNATDTTIAASAPNGDNIDLTATAPVWTTATYYSAGSSVFGTLTAPKVEIGSTYLIATVGTTDFTLIGAASNTVGLQFVATGIGVGSGTVTALYQCVVPNLSGTFSDDVHAGKWVQQLIFFNVAGSVSSQKDFELSYLRPSTFVEYNGASAAAGFTAGYSAPITCFGAWEVRTFGVWSADVAIQASSDGGITWTNVRAFSSRNDYNANFPGTASVAQLFRIAVSNNTAPGTPGATVPRILFTCVDAFLTGIVRIVAYVNAWAAKANVVTQLAVGDAWVSGQAYAVGDRVGYNGINYIALNNVASATNPAADPTNWSADGWPTIYWSEGAWSILRGFPTTGTAFGQRVWAFGTAFQPQRGWGTQTGDIENWNIGDGTLATDGLAFDLDATGDGAIVWSQSQDALFVGFVEAEWVIGAADVTAGISATNIFARRQSRWGSSQTIAGLVVGDALLFTQRQGYSLRQMLFSLSTNKYMSQDLTSLNEQIFNGGALRFAYQKQGSRNGFVWATTVNGELVAMTYELDQEVFGWSRHYTGLGVDGGFESVCCIEGSGTQDDEVWVSVNRSINGVATRFIERLNPINWQTVVPQPGQTPGFGPDKDQAYYVDCGQTYLNPATNVFGGLAYLNGRTVSVCINAQDYGQFLVVAGQITVDTFVPDLTAETVVQVGLPFTSTVQPMNLDIDVHTGVTQGITKRVTGVYASLLNTLGCKITSGLPASTVVATALVSGTTYKIVSLGTTDFTAVGAAANAVGTQFVASGPGTGTGTAGTGYRTKELIFRRSLQPFAEPALFTGTYPFKDFIGAYGLNVPVIVYTDGPLPLTVRGLSLAYEASGIP